MKPIKLEMHNFGPYVDQTIDFSEFFDAPVFLISGKTGTGKTTIFDAMVFALFGQTSGGERGAEEMRSDFASDQEPTSVTFEFEDHHQTYQITRSPKQTVASKRGNGQTTRTAKVSLLYKDLAGEKKEIDKINQANTFISELLNLTAEQFAQIVLLPQGQFRNFLAADSNSKETVLRELFGTKFYQSFVENIKERAKKRQEATEGQLLELQNVQKQAHFAEPLEDGTDLRVEDWLEKLQAELEQQAALLENYRKQTQENDQQKTKLDRLYQSQESLLADQQKLAELQKEGQALAAKQPHFDQLQGQITDLEWANQQRDLLKDLADAQLTQQKLTAKKDEQQQRAKQLTASLTATTDQQTQLAQKEPQIKNMRSQLERLSDKVDLYQTVEKLQQQQQAAQAQVKAHQQKVREIEAELAKNAAQQEQLTTQLAEIPDLHAQELALQTSTTKLEQTKKQLAEFKQASAQQGAAQQKLAALTAQLAQLEAQAQQAKQDYLELDSQYAQNQIVSLAARLKPGTPCPLCGSTDHPHPAGSTTTAPTVTKEAVKQAQERAQQAAAVVNTTQGSLTAQTETLNQQTAAMAEQQQALAVRLELPATASEQAVTAAVTQQQQEMSAAKAKYQQQLTKQQQLNDQLAALSKQAPQLAAAQQAAEHEKQQAQLTEQRLAATIEQQTALLPAGYASSQELQQQLADWRKQIETYEHDKETVQAALTQLHSDLAGVKAGLKASVEQFETAQVKEQRANQDLQAALTSYTRPVTLAELQNWGTQIQQLSGLRQELSEYNNQLTINQTAQKQLAERIGDQETPKIAETKQQIAELIKKQEELYNKRSELDHRYQENQATKLQVAKIWQNYRRTLNENAQWNELAEVVGGKGHLKLNLERYVLQSYFKQVIVVANQRFAELTAGRYSFCLDEEAGSYASKTGLELNIYDDNAGKIRSVHTLSGGESFIAALCLALALGEVVSAQAGGISVEALFVDEGFGSLDTESLQVALDALREIEGENRLIGIISHVTELRTEIPDQLHVTSVNGRSKINYSHEFAKSGE